MKVNYWEKYYGKAVYYGTAVYRSYPSKKTVRAIKIGETTNLTQRKNQLYYTDNVSIEYYEPMPANRNSKTDRLFVEAYLRLKLINWAEAHPILGLYHKGNDFFYYNNKYRCIVEKNIPKLFEKWTNEAFELL